MKTLCRSLALASVALFGMVSIASADNGQAASAQMALKITMGNRGSVYVPIKSQNSEAAVALPDGRFLRLSLDVSAEPGFVTVGIVGPILHSFSTEKSANQTPAFMGSHRLLLQDTFISETLQELGNIYGEPVSIRLVNGPLNKSVPSCSCGTTTCHPAAGHCIGCGDCGDCCAPALPE